MPRKILVIIPAHNEAASIGEVIQEIRTYQPEVDIVVVDDASEDATATEAGRLGVGVLKLPINLGIGGAVQTGFKYAMRRGYDAVIQVDGDGQHPASEIEKLLGPVIRGETDVAIGSRFLEGKGFQSSALRRSGIRMFQWLQRMITGETITDSTSGFRAYSHPAVALLEKAYPSDYPEVESITLLVRNRFRVMEVPVTMRERLGGRSSITLRSAIYYMIKVSLASFISKFKPRKRAP